MVLALVGLLAVMPISLTAMYGYLIQIEQHTLELSSFCSKLAAFFIMLFLTARGLVSLIAVLPRRSAQLGLQPVHRYVATRWPMFGYLIGLGPRPVPGLD